VSWNAGRESGATERAECTRGAGRRPRARPACVQTRSVCEGTRPPSRRQTRTPATGQTERSALAAPGRQANRSTWRRPWRSVARTALPRRLVGNGLIASSVPRDGVDPKVAPRARKKKSRGISALERTARPLRGQPYARAADAGRLSSWQRPTGERRGLSHKLIEPGTLRALTNAEIYKRTGQDRPPRSQPPRDPPPHTPTSPPSRRQPPQSRPPHRRSRS